ncbi:MAG TPA: hypothetical protein V6D20_02660 [Candidatus Obscuribacterales bacterium]
MIKLSVVAVAAPEGAVVGAVEVEAAAVEEDAATTIITITVGVVSKDRIQMKGNGAVETLMFPAQALIRNSQIM